MAIEDLKCGFSRTRCTVGINYTPDFKDLVQKKKNIALFLYGVYDGMIFYKINALGP